MGQPALPAANRIAAISASPAIVLNGIAVAFGMGAKTYRAVEHVDLTVGAQEFVAIVGPTGCGKSTLLNVVAGLQAPAAGTATLRGKPVAGISPQAGYLFQADALMPWKTALANVAVALQVKGMAAAAARERAEAWLARVGLKGFGARHPHQLSGGQKKRVALAQMLIREPDVLLMDEPFGPLDAQTRALMGDLLLGLWSARPTAVMFVTHDLDEAISLADRVVVMSAGPAAKIIASHAIDLPRPRAASEIRLEPRFHALQRAIWEDLRAEVNKAYAQGAA